MDRWARGDIWLMWGAGGHSLLESACFLPSQSGTFPDTKAWGWGWALHGRGGVSPFSFHLSLRMQASEILGPWPRDSEGPRSGVKALKIYGEWKNSSVSHAAFGGKWILLRERPFCSVEHRGHLDHRLGKGQLEAAGLL